MNSIKILKGGLFTTIQDKGRWNYQRFGMSVAGAMDHFAMRIANMLVDNDEYSAVLETTFLGPEIEFCCDEIIAITGANMSPKINGEAIQMWTSILVEEGDKLSFSGAINGVRTYISFSRGLDVPEIMGSKSTFVRGNLGGLEGRKLTNGDEIPLGKRELSSKGSYLRDKDTPIYTKDNNIRVVLGPQDDHFTDEALETFLNSSFVITSEADRMGYRLDGPKIAHKTGADIISDGIVFGSIQVPGHGSPILMMADRATTGGYTKIATVITPDLSTLAQMGPGSSITFEKTSVYDSHKIYKEYQNKFEDIKKSIKENKFEFDKNLLFNLNMFGKGFSVTVREIE
ncbi:MAG: biotin-dependent carboxyltransferase family protein [Gudongella sp.]|nr:biotin-dependent carboxyltransferase family protein [Gudongella sp.]